MQEVLLKIKDLYGFNLEWLEKVQKGFLSENNVLIDVLDNKKYFLKQYRFDKEDKIKEIHLVKKYFSDKGIPAIIPISTSERLTYFFFDNKYFALFPFILARHIESNDLSDRSIISLGKMLGNIHLAGKDSKLLIKERFEGWNKDKLLLRAVELETIIKNIENPTDFDKQALKDLELRRAIVESNTKTFQDFGLEADHLIHGDYHAGNVFFDDDDQVSHVFDFEKNLYAPRVFELFRSMVFIFFRSGGPTAEKISSARLYLYSYCEVYPISKEELEKGFELFYLRFVHGLWVQTEHYLKSNSRVDQFLIQDYERIKYFSEHLKELTKSIIN